MALPFVYADFNNLDDPDRLRLTCHGTYEDLQRQGIELHAGLSLTLYMDDADDEGRSDRLLVDGIIQHNQSEDRWVAEVDWDTLRHQSDDRAEVAVSAGEDPAVPPVSDSSGIATGPDNADATLGESTPGDA